MLKKIALLLTTGALALTACAGPASTPGSDEPPLDSDPGMGGEQTPGNPMPVEGIDGTWTFSNGTDDAGEFTTDSVVTIVISGNSIGGSSACNNYAANLQGEPEDVTISAVASTKRACESALMEFDNRYFNALEAVTAAIPTGGSLVLQGEGVSLNFLPKHSLPQQ